MTAAIREIGLSSQAVPLAPLVSFPEDSALSELPRLFDAEWLWQAYCQEFGIPGAIPQRIRIRQFTHSLGRTAVVSYEMEWPSDEYLPTQHFAAVVERGKPIELFQYPEDPRLPGLSEAAYPATALALLNKHVLPFRAKRAGVDLIRYRPASRAVLRHSAGKARFYARVMRPDAVTPLLTAHEFIARSDFVAPRLAGFWPEGGVAWFSEIPGKNLRQQIRRGKAPDPSRLLDGLQTLWDTPLETNAIRPFNLAGAYERAKRSFRHNVRDSGAAQRNLDDASRSLDSFVRSWRPAGIAHNDFYDDQMLVLPDGRIALVDFEEAGPGDPMLDVGNFLAHLRWSSRFGGKSGAGEYYRVFRRAALDRFHWSERDLALREAVCLFRICTNTIRHPHKDWRDRLQAGLSLVNEILD